MIELFYNGFDNVIQTQLILGGQPYPFNDQGVTKLVLVVKGDPNQEFNSVDHADEITFDNDGNIRFDLGGLGLAAGRYETVIYGETVLGKRQILVDKNLKKSKLILKGIDPV